MISVSARRAVHIVCLLPLCCLMLAITDSKVGAAGVSTRINVQGHYSITVPNDWPPVRVPGIDDVFRAPNGNSLVGVTARPGVTSRATLRSALKEALRHIGRPTTGLVAGRFMLHGIPALHLSAELVAPSGRRSSIMAIVTSYHGRLYVAMGFVRDMNRPGAISDLLTMRATINSLRLL